MRIARSTHPPFSEIVEQPRRALADGTISDDECEGLLFVFQKFPTVNPHFDQQRGVLQVLMGLLNGVAADGQIVKPSERAALSAWLGEWEHPQGLWPCVGSG